MPDKADGCYERGGKKLLFRKTSWAVSSTRGEGEQREGGKREEVLNGRKAREESGLC